MQYSLSNGKDTVYQWDKNITITIQEPENVPTVHFKWGGKGVPLPVTNQQVEIPVELLQLPKDIVIWAYTPDHTMDMARIPLEPRPKPADYVYTPTEIKTWEELDERIKALEDKSTLLYTEQSLTEDQQERVQTNIGVRYRLVGYAYYVWEKTTQMIYTAYIFLVRKSESSAVTLLYPILTGMKAPHQCLSSSVPSREDG